MATISETFAIAFEHHQAGRQSAAEQLYRQILNVAPNHFDALQLLGVIALQSRRHDAAIEFIGRAIQLNQNVATVHSNLGDAYLAVLRIPEAIACYRKALELKPDYAAAHINLGNALVDQGNLEEAIVAYCEGIDYQPSRVEAYCNLANVLLQAGRLSEADACCRKALELQPNNVNAHNHLGQVLQALGNLDAALGWYRRGLQLNPQSVLIHFNIARLFQEREQYALALNHYERATELAPEFAHAHHGLGTILYEQGELDQALQQYHEALRLLPTFARAHCSVGIIHQERGELDRAAASFRDAIQHEPACSEAYAHIAGLLRHQLPEDDVATIRRLVANSNLTMGKRSSLYFGLAIVDDARRDYSAAAEDLRLANSFSLADRQRRGITYHPEQHDRFVTELIEIFTPSYFERVRGFGLNSERPVFIVGLPRSGTTLTEQILASHSQVHAAGELGLGWSAFNALPDLVSRDLTASACLPYLDAKLIERIAKDKLERLALLDEAALRVTDKLPDNYLYAGLIATLFPHARIIHCRRDLRDIAVSCWMADFRQVHWTNCFEHIAARFRSYERLMAHWRRTLPVPMLEIDYEETVADVEGIARRLVKWCDLDWEPACAAFHEHRRTVRTASSTQVRQPIYSSSVDRWKHYEPFLTPLFAQLPNMALS